MSSAYMNLYWTKDGIILSLCSLNCPITRGMSKSCTITILLAEFLRKKTRIQEFLPDYDPKCKAASRWRGSIQSAPRDCSELTRVGCCYDRLEPLKLKHCELRLILRGILKDISAYYRCSVKKLLTFRHTQKLRKIRRTMLLVELKARDVPHWAVSSTLRVVNSQFTRGDFVCLLRELSPNLVLNYGK
jgi:hypothetical protein